MKLQCTNSSPIFESWHSKSAIFLQNFPQTNCSGSTNIHCIYCSLQICTSSQLSLEETERKFNEYARRAEYQELELQEKIRVMEADFHYKDKLLIKQREELGDFEVWMISNCEPQGIFVT